MMALVVLYVLILVASGLGVVLFARNDPTRASVLLHGVSMTCALVLLVMLLFHVH